jgi:hypothetical protein
MLNICQVSLSRDIPIILENYLSFKNYYSSFKIFVICPKNEIEEFKKKLNFQEFIFIDETSIISFKEFENIFEDLSVLSGYKNKFKERLSWYYQQILKLSFIIDFVASKKENIIVWDADTILLKKICFFNKEYSIKYGTLFEFHKHYYITNEAIIGNHPSYYISSLVQFIGMTEFEGKFLMENIKKKNQLKNKENISNYLSHVILKNIFKHHKIYNGSLFSEYELIGMSNYIFKKEKQKPIFTLRFGLDGKLTKTQKSIARLFNIKHVTYEHSHLNDYSQGMLERKQGWKQFLKIIFKSYIKFSLRNLRHDFNYNYNSINK